MKTDPFKVIFVLFIMVCSGCTGAVNEVVEKIEEIEEIPPIIDDVIEPFTHMMDWMEIGTRERSSPELVPYNSCDFLEEDLRDNLKERMRIAMLQQMQNYHGGGMWIEDDMLVEMDGDTGTAESAADSGGAASSNREEGVDFSGTNNQEEGVDESDFLKTDGHHIYMINDGRLVILGVPEFGEINFESDTSIEGNAKEMMLAGDKLVILSSVYVWSLSETDPLWDLVWDNTALRMRVSSLTKFTVFDITDRTNPVVTNELYLEGWYLTAREQNGMVRTITQGYLDLPGIRNWVEISPEHEETYYNLDWDHPARQAIWNVSVNRTIGINNEIIDAASIENLMPQMYHRTLNGVAAVPMRSDACSEFIAPTDTVGTQFTSILTLDLLSPDFSYQADHIMGNWPVVYASTDTLLIAEPAQDWWWYWGADELKEATNIHAFSLTTEGTSYIGSGRVDGTVLDQFSLSEYDGNIRLATTTGQWNRWWMSDPAPMENHVIILQPNESTSTLEEIGRVDGIAFDERIWSARFTGERAYIVTFRQIDPLWTIDLSDPTNPTIMGELEVPGVSTYIHPLDENNILTIGIGPANSDGTGLDWSNTQISLFDVSNFSNPQLDSVLPLSPVSQNNINEWSWGWSEATFEHKAFQYWGPKNMLAVPLSTYRQVYIEDEEAKEDWCEGMIDEMLWLLDETGEEGTSKPGEDSTSEGASEESEEEGTSGSTGDDSPPSENNPSDDEDEEVNLTSEDREFLLEYCLNNYHYHGFYKYEYVSKLVLVNINPGEPLSIYGAINHSQFYDTENCNYCYWVGQTSIKRSIFMGDYIYAISSRGVTVTNLTSMEGTGEIQFEDHISDGSDVVGDDGWETEETVVTGDID